MNILQNFALIKIIFVMLLSSTCFALVELRLRGKACDNGGFIIENSDGIQNCFCHGTGFYGTHCNIPCPSSYPVECIQV